jgi:hypothetical protein
MFGDKRGPMGRGEKSGRGLGYCSGYDTPGYNNAGSGFRGRGAGFGRGFYCGTGLGIGRRFGAGMGFGGIKRLDTKFPSENEFLKERKELLERELEIINSRLENLDK